MAIGSGDQLLLLGRGQHPEQIGIDRPQRPLHPDKEEIRQIGIADIVIIGRIGGDNCVFGISDGLGIMVNLSSTLSQNKTSNNFPNPIIHCNPIS